MTTIDQDAPTRLTPSVGDRIVYDGPTDGVSSPHDAVWDMRRTRQSLVIEVAGGWCHAVELGAGTWEAWSGRVESVKVVDRAVYTASGRERAQRLVEAERDVAGLRAQVAHLTEQVTESEYRLELAEAAAREMADFGPLRLYLPGDAEPAVPDPIGPSRVIVRNAVFASGTGYVYRQMHADEWYAAQLSSSVFSWEQVLGDGPCVEVTAPGGVTRLFDVLTAHRQYERDVKSAVWEFERLLDDKVREHKLDAPRDQEPTGSIAEVRAITARASRVVYALSSAVRRAGSDE